QDGTEPSLAFHDAQVGLGSLRQRLRLDDRLNFSLRYEIKGFVEILGAILLAADDTYALHDEVHQGNRKRLGVGAHRDKPARRPQPLNAVHRGNAKLPRSRSLTPWRIALPGARAHRSRVRPRAHAVGGQPTEGRYRLCNLRRISGPL